MYIVSHFFYYFFCILAFYSMCWAHQKIKINDESEKCALSWWYIVGGRVRRKCCFFVFASSLEIMIHSYSGIVEVGGE